MLREALGLPHSPLGREGRQWREHHCLGAAPLFPLRCHPLAVLLTSSTQRVSREGLELGTFHQPDGRLAELNRTTEVITEKTREGQL